MSDRKQRLTACSKLAKKLSQEWHALAMEFYLDGNYSRHDTLKAAAMILHTAVSLSWQGQHSPGAKPTEEDDDFGNRDM